MNDVMLDFETFGTGENKCVCQVGAVYFDKTTGELGKEFKENIDAGTQLGSTIDAQTVYWWLQQSDAARHNLLENRKDAWLVFECLNKFLEPAARIWSHATFDFVTLQESMRKLNIKPRFGYKKGLDLRTLTYLAGVKIDSFPRVGVHHDALDDCKHQVKYCVASLNAVKTSKAVIKFLETLGV